MSNRDRLREVVRVGTLVTIAAVIAVPIGFVVILFGLYLGASGSTGAVPTWDPSLAWWLATEEAPPVGVIGMLVGYLAILRRVPMTDRSLLGLSAPAAVATLAGGLAGAVIAPVLAALMGMASFCAFCRFAVKNRRAIGDDANVGAGDRLLSLATLFWAACSPVLRRERRPSLHARGKVASLWRED